MYKLVRLLQIEYNSWWSRTYQRNSDDRELCQQLGGIASLLTYRDVISKVWGAFEAGDVKIVTNSYWKHYCGAEPRWVTLTLYAVTDGDVVAYVLDYVGGMMWHFRIYVIPEEPLSLNKSLWFSKVKVVAVTDECCDKDYIRGYVTKLLETLTAVEETLISKNKIIEVDR